MSDACKSCSSAGADGSCNCESDCAEKNVEDKLQKTISRIKHKIVVMSGKGGVGKSTVAANIAVALSLAGQKVGLLDVDVHGPSIPRLLSMQGKQPHMEKDFMEPIPWSSNLWVMSLGFLITDPNQAVIWRGPMKIGLIKQFLEDVAWGDLDYLIIDCPPGTGDEPLSALQMAGEDALAVIVTTPQGVAVDDVRRSVSFVREVGNSVLGIVENMSGFVCPQCGTTHAIFDQGGGKALAEEMAVPFLGTIPIDPEMVRAGDQGYPFIKVHRETATGKIFAEVIKPMLALPDPA